MNPTDSELCAYLDEMLPTERASEIEGLLRSRPDLLQRTALLARRRDQGGHSVGEIWRRNRISCPSRSELGTYLLGVADSNLEDYLSFHLGLVGCRVCQANLDDLRALQASGAEEPTGRRQRYFESSAGLLRSQRSE